MTNTTKWLIALPFSVFVALILPAMITGEIFWFIGTWSDTLYSVLTTSMWLLATAFVDVSKPRGRPDRANRLISLGLIFSVPISVTDRIYLFGKVLPTWVPILGAGLCLFAIILGIWARISLGQSYSPRGQSTTGDQLVQTGPYRKIRHPMYTAACVWGLSWPLLVSSLISALITYSLVSFAVLKRIQDEEESLLRIFGEVYADYQKTTWRLMPYIY